MGDTNGIDTILNLTTLSEETELLSDEMKEFLRSNPVAYNGHRVISDFIQADGQHGTAEHNEIPFFNQPFFAIVFIIYYFFRRSLWLLDLSKAPTGFDGHVFVMHSTRDDKRHTLTAVGERLMEQDVDVLLLCSPEVERFQPAWKNQGFPTTSFIELLGAIPLRRWVSIISTSIQAVRGLQKRAPRAFGVAPNMIIFNFVFIEAVKTESLIQTTDSPTIHTYAPMGYVLAATEFDKVFSYQHGIMYGQESETGHQEVRRGYPFFAPINYLTWGEAWHEKFRYSVPPDAHLHPTGSPWHEFLKKSQSLIMMKRETIGTESTTCSLSVEPGGRLLRVRKRLRNM